MPPPALAGTTRQFVTPSARGDRRLRSQRPPADGSHRADRVPVNQRRNLAADRGFEPVVHRVQDASSAPGRPCYALRVLDLRDQRLFAEHVKARVERAFNQRRMTARRRANIDEVELVAG